MRGLPSSFLKTRVQNQIAEKLRLAFFGYFRHNPSPSELNSWRNSLRAVSMVFQYSKLNDQGIMLEYQLPMTSKRLDCLICGRDANAIDNAVIIELKHGTKKWSIRSLVVGLLTKKILDLRLEKRKEEEFEEISGSMPPESGMSSKIWLLIDEAHEFLPSSHSTAASYPLDVAIKEGRYPGITIVLATQNPGKLSSEAITQSDILISHRVTAKPDIEGLNQIHHTYIKSDIKDSLNELPRDLRGAALLFDDKRESISQIAMRPRMSWHAGGESSILKKIAMSGTTAMDVLRKMRKEE